MHVVELRHLTDTLWLQLGLRLCLRSDAVLATQSDLRLRHLTGAYGIRPAKGYGMWPARTALDRHATTASDRRLRHWTGEWVRHPTGGYGIWAHMPYGM